MTDRDLTSYSDPLSVLDDVDINEHLTAEEGEYVEAARAANTVRGYRPDWIEFLAWCENANLRAFPASAAAVSGYITYLAKHGAKVGTISRRLSRSNLPINSATCPIQRITRECSPCGEGSGARTRPHLSKLSR